MAGVWISEQSPPHIDPSQAAVAWGSWALPRLARQLRDPELETRQQALAALCNLVHDPEKAYEAINSGLLDQLKGLLKDQDPSVRINTTELLYLLATHHLGREAFLCCGILCPLSELLDEPVEACRMNLHRTLNRLAYFPSGAEAMVSGGLVSRLVQRVSEEEQEEVRALLLSTLSLCGRLDARPALDSNGVAVLGQQLSQSSPDIRRAAASALMAVSVPVEGKQKVCEEGLLPILVQLLSDRDTGVQANAAGTIMNTAIITEGKRQSVAAGAIPALLQLVSSRERAVCANALRALTTLAEAPSTRLQLLDHLPLLRSRTGTEEEELVRRTAETAVRVITWEP